MTDVAAYLEATAQRVIGRPLANSESNTLCKYLNLLIKWQKSQRLIGSNEPAWIVDNVIIDSLLFKLALPSTIATLADFGSGAGIPGIPLAVVLPDVEVALIEARQKRASFLAAAIRELGLRNCRLVNSRLEELRSELAGRFDAVVMRCAGNPTELVPKIDRLLVRGGVIVASGPPKRTGVSVGSWLELEGPAGTRRFWIHHVT